MKLRMYCERWQCLRMSEGLRPGYEPQRRGEIAGCSANVFMSLEAIRKGASMSNGVQLIAYADRLGGTIQASPTSWTARCTVCSRDPPAAVLHTL